jgi:thiol-disulfide isomerase/thioredoxin
MIALFASMAYAGYGFYNLVIYGSCEPGGFCIFNPGNKTITNNVCNITGEFVEFVGIGCGYCKNMEPIVAQVENETGIIFKKLEIKFNTTNRDLFLLYAPYIEKYCPLLGTPTFFATKTNRSICGEASADTLKRFIIENG